MRTSIYLDTYSKPIAMNFRIDHTPYILSVCEYTYILTTLPSSSQITCTSSKDIYVYSLLGTPLKEQGTSIYMCSTRYIYIYV